MPENQVEMTPNATTATLTPNATTVEITIARFIDGAGGMIQSNMPLIGGVEREPAN